MRERQRLWLPNALDAVDTHNPTADHPLNRDLFAWHLGLSTWGGQYWPDLTAAQNRADLIGLAATDWKGPRGRHGGQRCIRSGAANACVRPVTFDPSVTTSLTVSLWVMFNEMPSSRADTGTLYALWHQTSSLRSILLSVTTGDTVRLQLNNNAVNITDSLVLAPGQWYHVAAVWVSGTRATVYINGEQRMENTGPPNQLNLNTGEACIGARDLQTGTIDDQADGWFDDYRFYRNRALIEREIQQIYYESRQGYPTLLNRASSFVPLFGESDALPIAGDAVAEGAASMTAQKVVIALPIAGDAVAEGAASMVGTKIVRLPIAGDAIAEGAATLDAIGGAIIAGDAIAEGAASMQGIVDLPIAGDAIAEGDGQIANIFGIGIPGEAIAEGFAILNVVGSLAIFGDAVAEGTATVDVFSTAEIAGDATAEGFALLNVLGTLPIFGDAIAEGDATIDAFAAVEIAGDAVAEGFSIFDVRGTTAIFGDAIAEGIASMANIPPPNEIPIAGGAVAEGAAIFDVLGTFAIFGEAIAEGAAQINTYATVEVSGDAFAQGAAFMLAIGPTPPSPYRTLVIPFEDRTMVVPKEDRTLVIPQE